MEAAVQGGSCDADFVTMENGKLANLFEETSTYFSHREYYYYYRTGWIREIPDTNLLLE
jgi:hypothetical protein